MVQNPTVCPEDVAKVNPAVNAGNNQLVGTNYDASGNTKVDAGGQIFVYDAENKQVQVLNASGIVGQYFYDGDGKRVKKIVYTNNVPSETTIFVYDAGSKMVAEYSTVTADTPQVSYLTNDTLGSPRITTDANGQVISRRDFMPFGEEISRAGYGSDSVRQKFTSQERDNETGLDFAKARMYASQIGRFTVPDSIFNDSNRDAPQSWNLYQYTRNNPLKYIDANGKEIIIGYLKKDGTNVGYKYDPLTKTLDPSYDGKDARINDALNQLNLLAALNDSEIQASIRNSAISELTVFIDPTAINNSTIGDAGGGTISYDPAYDDRSGAPLPSGSTIRYDSVNGDDRLPGGTPATTLLNLLFRASLAIQGRDNALPRVGGLDPLTNQCVLSGCIEMNSNELDAARVENNGRRLMGLPLRPPTNSAMGRPAVQLDRNGIPVYNDGLMRSDPSTLTPFQPAKPKSDDEELGMAPEILKKNY